MKSRSSRRTFIATGLALPAAALASVPRPATQQPKTPQAPSGGPLTGTGQGGGLRYRTLGKTGLKVTSVGFGCMITSDPSVVQKAADIGITYFDTARAYQGGNNERMVGTALKAKRKDIILSTKSMARTAAQATADLETSLTELGTDHVDIWYMHARDNAAAIPDELFAVWENAKKQGKARFIGVSTHNPSAIVDRVL